MLSGEATRQSLSARDFDHDHESFWGQWRLRDNGGNAPVAYENI